MQDRSRVSDNEFPLQEENEEEPNVQFEDSPEPRQGSSLVSTTPENNRRSLAISGLDIVEDETMEDEKKKSPRTKRKVKRRKRKIDIDNDRTELTTVHIKAMLGDTSDIVRQNRTHPADYVPNNNDEMRAEPLEIRPWKKLKGLYYQEVACLPYEILFERPNIADDGALAPELLQLWKRNAARLRGEPFPFRLRGESGDAQRSEVAEEMMKEAAEEEDIEMTRRNNENELLDNSRLSVDQENVNEGEDFPMQQEEEEFPQDMEEEMPNPFDDEDENLVSKRQEGNDDAIGMLSPARSEDSQRSSFSLGAVNDLEDEISGESRQEQSDLQLSSGTKWHKHTVKVLDMLKKNMANIADHEGKPNQLFYDKLSDGVSRRTACGVFFELLQLKTWDFIELDQQESYSDIKIVPGLRFNEEPPTD